MVAFSNTDPVASPEASTNNYAIPPALRLLLKDHLSVNSTAIVGLSAKGKREVSGSKTEGAGVMLVESMGYDPQTLRKALSDAIVKQYAFSSEKKMMSTLVALPDGRVRCYTTGGSDFVLGHCTQVLQLGPNDDETAPSVPLTPGLRNKLTNDVITGMAQQSLRTLGAAYR